MNQDFVAKILSSFRPIAGNGLNNTQQAKIQLFCEKPERSCLLIVEQFKVIFSTEYGEKQ